MFHSIEAHWITLRGHASRSPYARAINRSRSRLELSRKFSRRYVDGSNSVFVRGSRKREDLAPRENEPLSGITFSLFLEDPAEDRVYINIQVSARDRSECAGNGEIPALILFSKRAIGTVGVP